MEQHNIEQVASSEVLSNLISLQGRGYIKLENKKNKQGVSLDTIVTVAASKRDLEFALKDEDTTLMQNILNAKFVDTKVARMV